MVSEYFSLAALWILFFGTHSALASARVKHWFYKLGSWVQTYYRITFNIISLVLLVPIIINLVKIPSEWLFQPGLFWQLSGLFLTIVGLYILKDSFKKYRTDEFIGTYQLEKKAEYQPTTFNRSGWNSVVRHPLYLGTIVFILGIFTLQPSIKMALTTFLVIGYTVIGTHWEEKKLVDSFGEEYINYKKEVSMLIPFRWFRKKLLR